MSLLVSGNVPNPVFCRAKQTWPPTQTKMTIEEFLALPEDDGVRRELIRGELREYPMTTRNAKHAFTANQVAFFLTSWMRNQESVQGVVVSGDARCQLFHDRETVVGIDVAVFLGEDAINTGERGGSFLGPPALAVEVLSLSDTHENTLEKLQLYLEANTPQIWIVDPDLQTVTVHRPNDDPVMFNRRHSLSGEPELAGFQIDVASLFAVKRVQA